MRIASCPLLDNPLYEIRHLEESDANAWFEYVSDPDAMKLTSADVEDVEQLRKRIRRANSDEPGTLIHYAIGTRQDGRLIGTVGFHTITQADRSAEITYDLSPGFWGRGIATAACTAAVDWAFSHLDWLCIRAAVFERNLASIKVLERCGFAFEGIFRKYRMINGRYSDFRMYSRFR